MSFGSHEGRLLEVFSHFGMIQKESSSDPEEALINVVLTTPKQRLLKDIAQLTEAFLAMQSLSPAETVNYLSFVTGSLFELVSHPDQDVRMAADEGINQIIKLADIQLVQHVIYEIFIEIKRSLHARSLSSALRKFSACINKIDPKKRRLYAIHILPALSGLITREEEMVWDCLSNSIQPVAVFIFPHTSQQELITILLKGLLEKIESDKNYIRRSAAKILASSVVHSRLPHELSYRLIQQLAGRVFVLKQRFLLDEASSETPATETATALQGCLWTLRNLASLFSRIPQPTSTGTIERTRSDGQNAKFAYLYIPLATTTGFDFTSWSRESLEYFWWSLVRLECLELACYFPSTASFHVMVCTAALECLLQVLTSFPAPPGAVPAGFHQALQTFFIRGLAKTSPLDDYASSSEISDLDEVSSVASSATTTTTATPAVVHGDSEGVTLVMRPLVPPSSAPPVSRTSPSRPRLSYQDGCGEGKERGEDRAATNSGFDELLSTGSEALVTSVEWFLPLFARRFCLLPGTQQSSRTSAQSLAVSCLAKLTLSLPPRAFFEPLRPVDADGEKQELVTGVEMALNLLQHSDPQVRGNACQLVGNLLRIAASHTLAQPTSNLDLSEQLCQLIANLDKLLSYEKSGITYRMAIKALRICANPLLHFPTLRVPVALVDCVSRHLMGSARHPYRLVRRETILLVTSLDWAQLDYLERQWYGCVQNGRVRRMVAASPLSTVAWSECLRLFADADRSLGREAFNALVILATTTSTNPSYQVDLREHLYKSITNCLSDDSALSGLNVVTYLLPPQDSPSSGFEKHLRALTKDLPEDVCISAPLIPNSHSLKALPGPYNYQLRGMQRVFRELVDCLLELPPTCSSTEDRNMMHSLIFGLTELLGRPPITSNHLLWYTPASRKPARIDEQAVDPKAPLAIARFALQRYQRRPKMALLCWHCLSLLTASPVSTTDLHLQSELLILVSGCILRWGISSLMEGSVPSGGTMELHPDHAFTRVSLVLLRHIGRLLSIFWHVFQGIKPTNPTSFLSGLVSGSVPINSAPIGDSSGAKGNQPCPSQIRDTLQSAPTAATSRPTVAMQLVQPSDDEEEESRLVIGSRNTYGYFAGLPHYMDLYDTLKASFHSFKSSDFSTSAEDWTMELLASTLRAFSRLLEGLRFAEVVQMVDEFLKYLEVCFTWAPSLALDAALNLLRALFGTNLSSIWSPDLASKFRVVLDGVTGTRAAGEVPKASIVELINSLHEAHFRTAELCSTGGGDVGREPMSNAQSTLVDWLLASRQPQQPAMLRPSSMPSNIQQPNLAYYIRLFEPLVLQCLHQYRLITDISVQAKILATVTILIELGVNYSQLDEQFYFLKTVMTQCEAMQHSNANASYSQHASSKDSAQLLSSMFQFFVALTYERSSVSVDKTSHPTVLSLSEVVHLAEVLAAGGVDVDSFVVPALAPLVVDVFVQRGARYRLALRTHLPDSPHGSLNEANVSLNKDLLQWNAYRESLLRFLLPKFIVCPSSYDLLCVIIEDALLTDATLKLPNDSPDSISYKFASDICQNLLSGLAANTLAVDDCGAVDACLRLLHRLVAYDWPITQTVDGGITLGELLKHLLSVFFAKPSHEVSSNQSVRLFQRWVASKYLCLRFLLLLTIQQPSCLQHALQEHIQGTSQCPDSVLLEHLLDLLDETCTALIGELPTSVDEYFSDNVESPSQTPHTVFIGQLLIALELEILAFNRLHCFSPMGIPKEKLEHLGAKLSIYSRLKPLSTVLWQKIQCDVFGCEPVVHHQAAHHLHSELVQETAFVIECDRRHRLTEDIDPFFKKVFFTGREDQVFRLELGQLQEMVASVTNADERCLLLKEMITVLGVGIFGAKNPDEVMIRLGYMRALSEGLLKLHPTSDDAHWSVVEALITSLHDFLSSGSRQLILNWPIVRREIEILLKRLLREFLKEEAKKPASAMEFIHALDWRNLALSTSELQASLMSLSCIRQPSREPENDRRTSQDLVEEVFHRSLDVAVKDGGRLAARLLHLKKPTGDLQLPNKLPSRFLQHVVRIGFVETMKRFNASGKKEFVPAGEDTFETDPVWQLGKELVFKELFSRQTQKNTKLATGVDQQRELVGVAAATIDFLLLSNRLPLPSELSTAEVEAISAFVFSLTQTFTHLTLATCQPPSPCLLSLPLLALHLLSIALSTFPQKLLASLDDRNTAFDTLTSFVEAVNISASLTTPVTLCWPHETEEKTDCLDTVVSRLRSLLVPHLPGLFHQTGFSSAHIPASGLTRFTEVLNSFAVNSTGAATEHLGSHVQLASAVGQCRLLQVDFAHSLKMKASDLNAQYAAALIALCRRPKIIVKLLHRGVFVGGGNQLNPDRAAELDRDSLAETSAWLLSLGWLDRSMFESTWTSFLAVCTPPNDSAERSDHEENPFANSSEEQVEWSHCRVIGINALTRLLLSTELRPHPGDPLRSCPDHRPRLSLLPHFMHTRLGGKIGSVLSELEREMTTWFYDVTATTSLVGCGEGNSGAGLSWLSTNLDLEYPAVRDSPGGQRSIECLVKRLLQSPSDPSGFEVNTVLSCLQSMRLVHQAWLRPYEILLLSRTRPQTTTPDNVVSPTSPSQKNKIAKFFRRGGRPASSSAGSSFPQLAFEESILLTGVLANGGKAQDVTPTETENTREAGSDLVPAVGPLPSLAVLSAVVKSAVVCSDLFTTREQYLWLIGCLQAVSHSLPPIGEGFEAPIYIWLTSGLARCTAVLEATLLSSSAYASTVGGGGRLEAAPQQHHSAPILLSSNLEPAVSHAMAALQSPLIALQDAGLRAAMDLFQASLILKATGHPAMLQPQLLANQPTGSGLINELLVKVCSYLDNRLRSLFGSDATSSNPPPSTTRFSLPSGSSNAFLKLTSSFSRNTSTRGTSLSLDFPDWSSSIPEVWDCASERVSQHQLTVLGAAFFVVEQFASAGEASTIGRLISHLIRDLTCLAESMLCDDLRAFMPPARLTEVFASRFAGTQASMAFAGPVLFAWTRGMQRLLLGGRISRANCEALAKLAADRLASANSIHMRLPALNLLVTCVYSMHSDFLSRATPDRDAASAEHVLSSSQEYLTCLWERLRGGGLTGVRGSGPHIAPLDARCVALALRALIENLVRSVLSCDYHVPLSALNGLVNKAVAEIARLDQDFPRLAASLLYKVFAVFIGSP
uniref:Non-specific serine/threonine protein kinase n=6 Tax=Mesocestoides corti TaxID=53468 RepID=A0A5K3F9L1_MESCO